MCFFLSLTDVIVSNVRFISFVNKNGSTRSQGNQTIQVAAVLFAALLVTREAQLQFHSGAVDLEGGDFEGASSVIPSSPTDCVRISHEHVRDPQKEILDSHADQYSWTEDGARISKPEKLNVCPGASRCGNWVSPAIGSFRASSIFPVQDSLCRPWPASSTCKSLRSRTTVHIMCAHGC